MRYIDNGTVDPREHALFPWLESVLTADVVGICWQTGFFEAGVLGVFASTLQRLANEDLDTFVLVGSNDGETQSSAVHQLVDLLGLPRSNASCGVVSFVGGYYHPKTIHVCYRDGREVAYVGSANMTSRGINGLNVEAGMAFDTDDGDPLVLLNGIKQAVREWFVSHPEGLFEVESHDHVNQLEARGILATQRARQRPRDDGAGPPADASLPRRTHHHRLPPIPRGAMGIDNATADVLADVLVAELAGPGRWGQAAFPRWFIDNFFKVLPNTNDVLRLWPVTQAGSKGAAEEAACGYKAGSKNWYYELGLAVVVGAYPQPPRKPIGVFHRIARQTFRYTILLPDDESYPKVSAFLAAHRGRLGRPASELPRTIVPAALLRDAWSADWFFSV